MDSITRFIEKEINPHCDEWEKAGIFPARELFKKYGDLGMLGLTKPEAFGGQNLDYTFAVAAGEALGSCNAAGVPMAIGVQTDMATPALANFGSDEVRREFLAPSISGDMVACLGVSEVGGGSDVASLKTTAVKDGDDYIINGGKMWTTSGTQAHWMCTLVNTSAATSAADVHTNKTLVCIPMDTKGVSVAPRFDKLGMRSSDTTQVYLEDVRVPQKWRVGEEGKGFIYQMEQFQEERIFAAAGALRPLMKCIDDTVEYTSTRKAFGKPIIANQAVRFRLAEMKTEVEMLRSLIYRTAAKHNAGDTHASSELATMCKLKVGRLCREVTDGCLQYWGGMGFMNETFVSRMYRDTRLYSIGGGADEVMLEILSKGLVPSRSK